jgi:hypothetical protein
MDAYRKALGSKQDLLVLQPDSEFFKYFNSETGISNLKPELNDP